MEMKFAILVSFAALVLLLAGCAAQAQPQPLPGSDRDSHGCISSAGYSWCEPLSKCIREWEQNCTEAEKPLGGDRDEHGCIGSAGYTWCEPLSKCIREWEQNCTSPVENNQTAPRQPGKEGEFCGGIAAFPCEPGLSCVLDGTYPDAGGKCEAPAERDDTFYICPSIRNEACTREYVPVCGRLVGATPDVAGYATFGNACDACSTQTNAIGYYKGDCESRGN